MGAVITGGKLPITWYPESFTAIPMTDMNMRADPSRGYPGRTYRFYTGDVVYGFGYGLSYSKYSYSILSAPKKITVSRSSVLDIISRRENYVFDTETNQSSAFGTKKLELYYLTPS